jgi:hypothetical protein
VVVIIGLDAIYEWAHHGEAHGPLDITRSGWLSQTMFVVRAGIYFGIWILLSRSFLRRSLRQDETGDPALSLSMEKTSTFGMILFAVTVTIAAFDILMSLDAHWYSTMYGVYYFSGAVVGFFALLILATFLIQRTGRMAEVSVEHYHDMGKQLFGYMVFWAYIAFSQFMLIWYASIPEETEWFLLRQSDGWEMVGRLLIIGHFVLPFLALLPRMAKRKKGLLAGIALWILAMHYFDIYYLVMPEKGLGGPNFGAADILCLVGLSGLFVASVALKLGSVPLVPQKDPRLPESLAFENS